MVERGLFQMTLWKLLGMKYMMKLTLLYNHTIPITIPILECILKRNELTMYKGSLFYIYFKLTIDTIINASLASQIRTEYMKSSILYDRILRARIIPLNKSDTSFSVDINSPSKSLKGVLLIFTQERSATKFARDTEEFYNPKITTVEVTVERVPNELHAQNMEYRHQYDEIVKHFAEGRLKEAGTIQKDLQLHNVNIASYYTYYTDKYAL